MRITETEPLFRRVVRAPKPLPRFIDQLWEQYARKKAPAHGQKDLFGGEPAQNRQGKLDWDEKLHPREDDGKFAEKGEGETKPGPAETKPPADETKPLSLRQGRAGRQRRGPGHPPPRRPRKTPATPPSPATRPPTASGRTRKCCQRGGDRQGQG